MTRLSAYLIRHAALAALVAVAVIFGANIAGDWLMQRSFLASLPPALRLEYETGTGPLSPALGQALQAFYESSAPTFVLAGALLLGVVAGGLVGLVPSRRLLRPIEALADAAERLGAGNTRARTEGPPSGIAEIDLVAGKFNAMAQALADSERNLRETNAAIAHELRTPLTVLTGRIAGMQDGVFPTDRTGLEVLAAQTGQLARLVDDLSLLTLARAGQFRLDLAPVDLAEIAAEAARGAADVTLALAPAPALADPMRLRQMLAALLSNARRYAPGAVTLETAQEGPDAVLRVMDRGPGLAAEDADRAFERFWRAEPSRGREGGGSGLGLPVVRALAEAQGGQALYRDRAGGGAVFELRLPAARHAP